MKNTTYALAREHLTGPIEDFGRTLAEHFVAFPQVAGATVSIREHAWTPIPTSTGPAGDAFLRTGELTRTAVVRASETGVTIEAGLEEMTLMKTAKAGFAGFPRDELTTPSEVGDRLMASRLSATWRYGSDDVDFDAAFEGVLRMLLDVFAEHDSPSIQASAWTIGQAILEAQPEVDEIRLTMPNLHHWLVDLAPFGQVNDREIYVATSEPNGLVEATVRRGELVPEVEAVVPAPEAEPGACGGTSAVERPEPGRRSRRSLNPAPRPRPSLSRGRASARGREPAAASRDQRLKPSQRPRSEA